MPLPDAINFVQLVLEQARLHPNRLALVCPEYTELRRLQVRDHLTYRELAQRIQTVAQGLQQQGLQPGDRVVVAAPLSADLFAVVLGLMSIAAVPVLLNPGMGPIQLYQCIKQLQAQGLVLSSRYRVLQKLLPVLRKIPHAFTLPAQPLPQVLAELKPAMQAAAFTPVTVSAQHTALITYTSGSSGLPKGVNRTHGVLLAQYEALKTEFPPLPEQTDMPGFPVLTLYNLCCGVPTVLPLVNFRKVDKARPELLLEQIQQSGINTLSGAPAYLRQLIRYCTAHHITLPQIKGLATGGAPIAPELCRQLQQLFPEAEIYLAYGSSEAEPVAAITASEVLSLAAATEVPSGYCVGKPAAHVELRILPQGSWEAAEIGNIDWRQTASNGAVPGEVVVTGAHVCQGYFRNPAADKANKLQDENGRIWHRMGDIGFLDKQGLLWLTGRRENLLPLPAGLVGSYAMELLLNRLPGINRAAVIAGADGQIAVFAETDQSEQVIKPLVQHVLAVHFHVYDFRFTLVTRLPVDARHQSKIDTPRLKEHLQKPWRL